MKIAVLTPTYRFGGLDINWASILAQDLHPDLWVIADDLHDLRSKEVIRRTNGNACDVCHFKPREKPEGYFSDLANIYNEMLEVADSEGCDLAISAQDYLWMPEDGIRTFAESYDVSQMGDAAVDDRSLVTGSCSLSYDPRPDQLVDREGKWTVFGDDYDPRYKPQEIWWRDVRLDIHQPGLHRCDLIQWELNWACIPLELYREGARFPEHYGKGIAHENVAFAVQSALDLGATTWIDVGNHAIGLPHKHYWPEQEEVGLPHAMDNMEMFHSEYDGKMGIL